MLVDHQLIRNHSIDGESPPDPSGNLLEARNKSGLTAFLVSCYQKDFGLMELLLDAGADVTAVDRDGNSAIVMYASNPADDISNLPAKIEDLCPSIFEVK